MYLVSVKVQNRLQKSIQIGRNFFVQNGRRVLNEYSTMRCLEYFYFFIPAFRLIPNLMVSIHVFHVCYLCIIKRYVYTVSDLSNFYMKLTDCGAHTPYMTDQSKFKPTGPCWIVNKKIKGNPANKEQEEDKQSNNDYVLVLWGAFWGQYYIMYI